MDRPPLGGTGKCSQVTSAGNPHPRKRIGHFRFELNHNIILGDLCH